MPPVAKGLGIRGSGASFLILEANIPRDFLKGQIRWWMSPEATRLHKIGCLTESKRCSLTSHQADVEKGEAHG